MAAVGVKYCGGCRADYDRRAEASRTEALVREALRGFSAEGAASEMLSFDLAEPGRRYDALLVLCGCSARCAELSPYDMAAPCFIDHVGGSTEAASMLVRELFPGRAKEAPAGLK